jgi:formyltetrahydrofolate deformylase
MILPSTSHPSPLISTCTGGWRNPITGRAWRFWFRNMTTAWWTCIVSNHPDSQPIADFYRIPFFLVPVEKDDKLGAERQVLSLLERHGVDFIVLARYMQILSDQFVNAYPRRIINIHHSFLPAFVGSKPYHQAFTRGVKLIGATSHYVTEVLDDGPIIEQDVVRVSHRDSVEDLIQKGRDLEKVVLSRAVRWHVENRVLLYGNKTVVFE